MESTVPSKTVKGGMSQKRYDRIRDDALNEFFRKVAEEASELLLKQEKMKNVIIGGPGPVKDMFYRKSYLNYQIQNKVIGVKDIGSTDEYGLEELVVKSQDLLQEAAITKERELIQKFFTELKNGGNVVYGYEDTKKALEAGAVETLLISEAFNWVRVKFRCTCGITTEKEIPKTLVDKQKCSNCNQKLIEEGSTELADELIDKATSLGTKVEYISTESSEGNQFKELSGVGAFLRFKLS
jgi:peptide chain release factor subunit 1